MTEEYEVKLALLSIIKRSIHMIRGNSLTSDYVYHEAYHIHNLPDLVSMLHMGALKYYWDIERVEYIKAVPTHFSDMHKSDWDVISKFLSEHV